MNYGSNYSEEQPQDHGEGNWLVSYADMMTLLVGFFVILLSFSTVDEEKFEELKRAVTMEFGGIYVMPFAEIGERIRAELKKTGFGDQFVVKTNDKGIEISFLGTAFFATGSADFKPEAKALLDTLIPTIKKENVTFEVLIEGHTDDVPLASGGVYRNNFELSSIRACRVLDYFAEHEFAKEHLTAVGYGEARPLVPNRDAQGNALPNNQSQNRRVVIKLFEKGGQVL